MVRVLFPIGDPRESCHAVRHVIKEFWTAGPMEIHLLHVQPRLRQHVGQFLVKEARDVFYRDQAERALSPIRLILDRAGTPYLVHTDIGPKASVINAAAAQLGCDCIVMGMTRTNALMRALEDSVIDKVLQLTAIPVVVIAGEKASKAERYGGPALVGGVLALVLYTAAD